MIKDVPPRRGRRFKTLLSGVCLAACVVAAPPPAVALDCEFEACLDVSLLPGGVDWADLVDRGQRFFAIDTRVYIVSFEKVRAPLPYMQRALPPIPAQVHIPEIYHAAIESKHSGERHYVWHYIIGHEFAHVYQDELKLIEALRAPYRNRSHVAFELHADFLAGFFIASQYGLSINAIDNIFDELNALPSGEPGDETYHGEPHQRFYMATQGALMALRSPRPSLAQASAEGVRRLGEVLPFGG